MDETSSVANKTQLERMRQDIGFSISVQISISQVFQSITDKVKIVPVYIHSIYKHNQQI